MAFRRNCGLELLVASLTLTFVLINLVEANSDGDALYALRQSLSDPDHVLQSWDQNLVNPCTWFHVSCNQDSRVTRVDLGNSNLSGHLTLSLASSNIYSIWSCTKTTSKELYLLNLETLKVSSAWIFTTTILPGRFLLLWGS
ncbi:unnamed protein product [Brassica napus]|uniref:(rape) hypothetical protein n=1 Tax=Brassica napus TaxID=3708 RepID=A0A816K3Q2_BRANA|nr:unnamed protein product [Brassica napus]